MRNILTCLFLLLYADLAAQEKIVYNCPSGIYVILGQEISKTFTYRISRAANNGAYKMVANVIAPLTKEDLENRITVAEKFFPLSHKPVGREVERIWNEVSVNNKTSGIFLQSVPIEPFALGLSWLDTVTVKGTTYKYKVERLDGSQVVSAAESNGITYNEEIISNKPTFLNAQINVDELYVRWALLDRERFGGITVFRRDNLQGDFRQIKTPVGYRSNQDTLFIVIKDTLVKKYEIYEYKLRAYDWLGNQGTFTVAAKASMFSTHDFPVLRHFTTKILDDRKVELQWSIEKLPFLRSIRIMRSMYFDSAFVLVAEVSPFDSVFVDVLPVSMEDYFYRLILNGPDEVSIPTATTSGLYRSTAAPMPPTGISARGIKGGVLLTWKDRQNNVAGYEIFRQSEQGNFQLISDMIPFDTARRFHYTDTSNVLKGYRTYAYAIKTISDSYVGSTFSDTLKTRPDIPVQINAPGDLMARKTGDKVYLIWTDMTQLDPNVAGYRIFRKMSAEENLSPLTNELLPVYTNHYTDTTIERGYGYQYAVKSYSAFGDESALSELAGANFYLPLPAPPAGIYANNVPTGIHLHWDEVLGDDLSGYVIYKQQLGEQVEKLMEVSSDQFDFTDASVAKGELYFYFLATKNEENIEGPKSDAIVVRH